MPGRRLLLLPHLGPSSEKVYKARLSIYPLSRENGENGDLKMWTNESKLPPFSKWPPRGFCLWLSCLLLVPKSGVPVPTVL